MGIAEFEVFSFGNLTFCVKRTNGVYLKASSYQVERRNQKMRRVFERLTVVTLSVLFLTSILNHSSAQEATQPREPVKTIFDYKAELGMTDDQAKRIREILTALERETRVLRAKFTIVDVEVQKLIEADGDLGLINTKIREAFEIQASIKMADVEASRKINAVLKPEQLRKWHEIKAAAIR